jgi:Eukaryotic aspartyl protease
MMSRSCVAGSWLATIAASWPLAAGCGGGVADAHGSGDTVDASIDARPAADAAVDSDAADASPLDAAVWPARVPLVGCSFSYAAMVSLGGARPLPMSLDTGSLRIGVAETGCSTCEEDGVDSLYTPGASAVDLHQTWSAEYADMQTWSGELYEDSMQLVGSPLSVSVELAAIETESQFFYSFACSQTVMNNPSGILGLAPRPSSDAPAVGLLDQLVAAGMPDVFAVELCPTSGNLWLGGFDPSFTTGAPQYTALIPPVTTYDYYAVYVASISLGGAPLAIPASTYGSSLVDTGGHNFLVPTAAYTALTQGLNGSTSFTQLFGDAATWFSSSGQCVLVTQSEDALDATLPPVTLTLGSTAPITLDLAATHSYVELEGSSTGAVYACPAMFDYHSTSTWDIADNILRANVTIFDRANQRMGFAPHDPCP